MPGFEYETIVTGVSNIDTKITNELTNKKFQNADISDPSSLMGDSIAPLLGMFASAGVASMALPMPSNPLNQIAFEAVSVLNEAITAVQGSINGLTGSVANIAKGGINGLLAFGRAVLPLVARLVAVVAAIGVVCFEIWYTFDQIGESVSGLYEAKAALEVQIGGMESKLNKVIADNALLKAGMISLEKSLTTQIKEQATKIQTLETEVSNLETLIQENHAQSMAKLTGIDSNVNSTKTDISNLSIQAHNDFLSVGTSLTSMNSVFSTKLASIETKQTSMDEFTQSQWSANEIWQINNRSAVTATLTAAALEAPDRPLDNISKAVIATKTATEVTQAKLTKAVEGNPTESDNDTEYKAAIAAGGAIAAGTIGYAAWKASQGGFKDLKGKMDKLGSMIDLGRILDVMNLITNLHNAAMLSRDIFETLIQTVDNGLNAALNAFGVKNINDEGVDSKKYLSATLDTLGKQIFGVTEWNEIKAKWAALNKIVSTGNTLLWSIRELGENVNSIAERAAENTGKIGNALKRSGILQEPIPWMPENYSYRSRLSRRMTEFLEGVQNAAQMFEQITAEVLNIQYNIKEIGDNNKEFQESLAKWEPKETTENEKIKTKEDELFNFLLPELKPGDLNPAPTNT